ncbi:DNA-binding protein RFX7 isoform X1 [Siphateles boraxobius]|uniref:DNA-binding protein RFX7 isoform X1 n=2 Tax=Siphateles boraxobius TaxID=180520 RepID=UPI004064B775
MADDQQQSGPGVGPLPSAVQGLQGPEANALQLKIKNSICKTVQSKVDCILQDVEKLTDIEKLYLYLKLPSGPSSGIEKNEQSAMSSSRSQQLHAFSWIRNHLEEHPETSLPKQEVYDEYKSYCDSLGYHALSAADFGKIMKNVFPTMKARRLGMRGKSKYCYSGLRKKACVHMPSLPNLDLHKSGDGCEVFEATGHLSSAEDEVRIAACGLVCEWAQKVLSRQFDSVDDLARFLLNSHYIGTKSVAALTVMTGSPSGAKMSIQSSAFAPTADAHSFQPQVKTLVSPSVDAKQQLQRKIQKKQQEQKLHSPLPGEAQARRVDGGITPGAGTGIPCRSPALLSPQPIGIVVAAVSSPITVQRSKQLTSPSPLPMAVADSKVLPVNFQVVTQSVQPVKQCPKMPHNIPASPVSDRSARQRYAQILPKPSASSGITLRSPTLLITNSPIKTVMSTPHVSSVNVVKMTTISLGSNGSGTNTPADTPTSNKIRPSSAGVASLSDDPQPVTRVRSGSIAAMSSVLARSGRSTTMPVIDTKTNIEAIIGGGQEQGGTSRLATTSDSVGVQRSGILKPRATSVPTPLDKGSLGLYMGTKCNGRTLLSANTLAAGSNNTFNTNESTLYQNTCSTQSISSNAVVTSPKDVVLASKSPHKRPGLCIDLSPTPVKKAHISVLSASGSDEQKSEIMMKQFPRSCTPIRPESAPLTAIGKATAAPVRDTGFQTIRRPQSTSQGRWEGASSLVDYIVPIPSTSSQDLSVGNTMFQTVSRPRSISQGRWEGSSTGIEGRVEVTRTVSAPGQALLQQRTKNSQNLLIDQSDDSSVYELKSVFWDSEPQDGTQQHQEVYGPQMVSEPKQMSTPVMEHLPPIAQPSPANQQAQMIDYGTQANVGYYAFNDDDMTQDSIVEELVQMEEQMKINNSIQSFSNCVDISLQGQHQTMQTTIMSTFQTNTLYYSSAHSSSTPIQTPTPTPTPTSEIMGNGQGLMQESPCLRLVPTTPVDSALGSSRQTPIGTPHSNCSSSVPPSPVECRNPFAFTPINSSITGYHDGITVSSSPVKPMQRPMATHPDKTKLEWMNSGYNNSGGNSNNCISILPSYQDLVDDHFRKPHAFAIPGQTCQPQSRHHDTNVSRLTPISPVQQQVASMASLNKKEGFAVPAPLDNKASTTSGSGTFRCRSVSPAVRQRNLSGTQAPNVPHSVVSPFNSPVTPEVLNIFSNFDPDISVSSMAQRSQSVPVTVMMQSEVLPMQSGKQINTKNITNVLISKMDVDGDDSVRGLGINNMPSNYTARMNLTQILETTTVPSFPGSASHQALISPCSSAFESQKPGYLMKNAREEPMSFSVDESQAQSASGEHQPSQQKQHLGRRQLLGQEQQSQAMLLPLQQNLQQHQHQQPLDLDRTVKDLLNEEILNASSQLVGQGSKLSAGGSEFPSDMRLTSELTGGINDLNTLDTNLLFDPSQQPGQYEDSTLEELKNDPLFQQICSETVNSAGFDWLESKDQATVEMLG